MGHNKKGIIASGTEFPVTRPIQDATEQAPTLYRTGCHCSLAALVVNARPIGCKKVLLLGVDVYH